MVKKNYTHITFLLDRTGSMATIQNEVINGFNVFVKEQQKEQGKATFSLIQFDSQDPNEIVYDFVDINKAVPLTDSTFIPRAMTPLLDAMAFAIKYTDSKLQKLKDNKSKNPNKVILVVLTDGQENASHHTTKAQIKELITAKQGVEGWAILFLGANMDAVAEASAMGINADTSMTFAATSVGTTNSYMAVNRTVSSIRSGNVSYGFTNEDRNKAVS